MNYLPKHTSAFSLTLLMFVSAIMLASSGCRRSLSSAEMLERGILLAQREHFGESLEYFGRALDVQPGNPDIYYERAVVYEQQEKYELALADYAEAIRLDPQFLLAYNNRAIRLAQLGRHDEAIKDLTSIVQVEPGFASAYELRAISHRELGNDDKALADIDHFIELVPTPEGHAMRGSLQSSAGQFAEALEDFNAATEQGPHLARAWLGRAVVLAQLGRPEEARENLQRAVELDSLIVVDDVLEALDTIQALDQSVAIDQQRAIRLLSDLGWHVERQESELFPFVIRKRDDAPPRQLCVASMDRKQEGITMSGDKYMEILAESRPKSLLIATPTDHADASWQFIEDWRPSRENMRRVTVIVEVENKSRQTLVQASAVDAQIVGAPNLQ